MISRILRSRWICVTECHGVLHNSIVRGNTHSSSEYSNTHSTYDRLACISLFGILTE